MQGLEAASTDHLKLEQRASRRYQAALGGRITWRDRSGLMQSAQVVTRDVSEYGAFIEFIGRPRHIPRYRLVTLQLDSTAAAALGLPDVVRRRRLLTVVWRSGPFDLTYRVPTGYALRLLVEPRRAARPDAQPVVTQRVA